MPAQKAFSQADTAVFAGLYPDRAGLFRHSLVGHELFSLEALAEAAGRMAPGDVDCREADNALGAGFPRAEPHPEGLGATIREIGSTRRWVGFKRIEQLPEYREVLHSVLGELTEAIGAATGEPQRLEAFLFVSAPGTISPLHIDPEFNILMHLAGTKCFTVFDPDGPWLSDHAHELYHTCGDNLVAWQADYASAGTPFDLAPGDALYVPFKAPHWVKAGPEPAISLSVTWCSVASLEQNDAWMLNAWLRRKGIRPSRPRPLPARSRAKSLAWRTLRRLGAS